MLLVMDGFIAALVLLVIASGVHLLAKKLKLPYTILLFIVGIALIPLVHTHVFGFLDGLVFTPEILFYVFLPVLIFESGYSIKYQQLARNGKTIRTLAILGLLMSAAVIGFGGYWLLHHLGWNVPLEVMLLFGVIISATDPVAVLAIFKDLGVPRRLSLLFEGESLFNDGTAVAIFLILIEIMQKGSFTNTDIFSGSLSFLVMVFGGILLGLILGVIFAKVLKNIKNNEVVEITMTMLLAHFTFILAEMISHHVVIGDFDLKISGVIATAYAAILMGNYGKTKISPKVEEYMHKFRNFFAFVVNSLVFLLMGLLLKDLHITKDILVPIGVAIVLVTVARAISIYLPINALNLFKRLQKRVPGSWQHLMAWGDLRGVVGLTLALMIPEQLTMQLGATTYGVKEFVLILVISVIVFSLVVKGLTIKGLIRKFQIDKLHDLEEFEKIESEILIYNEIIDKIHRMKADYHTSKTNYDALMQKYTTKLELSQCKMKNFLESQKDADKLVQKALALQALGIEKEYLKQMYTYHEVDEYMYLYFLGKIDRQMGRVERGEHQLRKGHKTKRRWEGLFELVIRKYKHEKHKTKELYTIYRTKFIITSKVLMRIKKMRETDFAYDKKLFDDVMHLYETFHENARAEIASLKGENIKMIHSINENLLNKGLMKTEEKLINDLLAKEMITDKLHKQFTAEIEEEVFRCY